MFDKDFFENSLPQHVQAKAAESADQPSVQIKLHNGRTYSVASIKEKGPGWLVLVVYPPKGKRMRQHSAADRKGGTPRFDLDRVAVAYNNISEVTVTLEAKSKGIGFDSWRS